MMGFPSGPSQQSTEGRNRQPHHLPITLDLMRALMADMRPASHELGPDLHASSVTRTWGSNLIITLRGHQHQDGATCAHVLPLRLEEDFGCLKERSFCNAIHLSKETILHVSLQKRYLHCVLFSDFTCLNRGLLFLLVEIICSNVNIYP